MTLFSATKAVATQPARPHRSRQPTHQERGLKIEKPSQDAHSTEQEATLSGSQAFFTFGWPAFPRTQSTTQTGLPDWSISCLWTSFTWNCGSTRLLNHTYHRPTSSTLPKMQFRGKPPPRNKQSKNRENLSPRQQGPLGVLKSFSGFRNIHPLVSSFLSKIF